MLISYRRPLRNEMEDWASKVNELIPELIREHKKIHDIAVANAGVYMTDKRAYDGFEALVEDHMYKEEAWLYPFMVEQKIFDDRSEEIASQHHEITSILTGLESADSRAFAGKFTELVQLLQAHHSGEEGHVFPRVLDFIGAPRRNR